MVPPKTFRWNTLAIHAGQSNPDRLIDRSGQPIDAGMRTFRTAEEAESAFNGERGTFPLIHPIVAQLEQRIAALDGGVDAVATSSRLAAIRLAILTLMDPRSKGESHVVAVGTLDSEVYGLLKYALPRIGVDTTFVASRDVAGLESSIRPSTYLVLGQSLGMLGLDVLDICSVARTSHQCGVPLMVDSSMAAGLCQPIQLGADLVVHDTRLLSGQPAATGGILVDAGTFDWSTSHRFATLAEPAAGFHGINFDEEFGPTAFAMRARIEALYGLGVTLAPAVAALTFEAMPTLEVRNERKVANADALAGFLCKQATVEGVNYPSATQHVDHQLSKQQFPNGCGAMFSFLLKGGRAAAQAMIDRVRIFQRSIQLGTSKSVIFHPESTTHCHLDEASRRQLGVDERMVCISAGLEDINDLLDELKRVLRTN